MLINRCTYCSVTLSCGEARAESYGMLRATCIHMHSMPVRLRSPSLFAPSAAPKPALPVRLHWQMPSILDYNRLSAAPACVCLLLTLTASLISAASVRGVPANLLPSYDTTVDKFRCLDGGKTIPVNRVNDDYCDCLDGSDEPGLAKQPW